MIIQLEHIRIFVKEVMEKISNLPTSNKATVVFLSGDLGSGKTTFTKTFACECGIQEDITSPTFVILKRYEIASHDVFDGRFKNLIHIDAYRLKSYEELQKIKFEKYLADSANIILIEWPEMVKNEKLVADISLQFTHSDMENERVVEII